MQSIYSRPTFFWLAVIAAGVLFVYAIKAILLPFILGALVAYFFDPVADRLERIGFGRGTATMLITLMFFGVLALGLFWLVPTLIKQGDDLIREMPRYLDMARHWAQSQLAHYSSFFSAEQIDKANGMVNGAGQSGKEVAAGVLSPLAKGLLSSGKAVVSLISLIVLSPIVSFYLLRDWDKIIAKIDELLPRAYAKTIREQAAIIDETISGYVRGIVNVMLILGTFYVIGLSLIGLDYAILIGILGGIAIVVPYVGTIVSGGAAVGMAYLQFDGLEPVLITLAIFTTGQLLEGYILTPKLVGDKIGLHPLWLIFGMLAGGALFGFVGVLLAIPVTAIIGVLLRFALNRYKESGYYGAKPAKAT